MTTENEAYADAAGLFAGPGEVRESARELDWSKTSMGPTTGWSLALRTMVRSMYNSPFPTCLWSGPDYALIYNDPYGQILGPKHPASLGRPGSIVWKEVWERLQPQFDSVRAGGDHIYVENAPFVITRPGSEESETAWFDYALSALQDEDGSVVAVLNVSPETTIRYALERRLTEERVRAEEQLRALNADLERQVTERALGRSRTWAVSPEVMGVINAEGHFEQSNPAWASVLGWSDAEVADVVFFDFVHPDDLARTRIAWADAIERGVPALRFENRYRHKSGGWRWLSWVAVPDRGKVYCTARDVTAEKEQAADLDERTAERDRMWETSPDLMLVIDFDGVFRRVNPAWTTQLGYEAHDLVGRHVNDFVVPDDQGETTAAYELAAAGGQPTIENRYRHKDGSIRWISWTAAPAGELTYATGRDITHEKEREAELQSAQEALRQSQKMEAMGSLTGGVAHDFNNLLTPIIGSLDMLVRKGVGSERERRLIDGALQSAERAKTLVQRLLAFARRQPLQATAVNIANLVRGLTDLLGSTLGPTIDIRVDLASDLPPAKADPNQLEMALLNLAVNARDAMPAGGELIIAARRLSIRGQHPSGVKPGHYVGLCVKDTGTGMDEATLHRATEPFFSTKGVGQGTGLGLSMVYGLAAQLNGGLSIESTPGDGTTIELLLPISAILVGDEEEAHALTLSVKACGLALLVDDEELVRMSTADMLFELGFDVAEASSAEEALSLLRSGLEPCVVVTDHLKPGMSGSQLARELKAHHAKIPVLIVSGYAEADGIDPDVARLTKPFRSAALAEALVAMSLLEAQ